MAGIDQEGNGIRWTVRNHEDRLKRLEAYELAVIVRNITDLEDDVRELRSQLKWQTRALIGAMLTMVGTLAIALLVFPHG